MWQRCFIYIYVEKRRLANWCAETLSNQQIEQGWKEQKRLSSRYPLFLAENIFVTFFRICHTSQGFWDLYIEVSDHLSTTCLSFDSCFVTKSHDSVMSFLTVTIAMGLPKFI